MPVGRTDHSSGVIQTKGRVRLPFFYSRNPRTGTDEGGRKGSGAKQRSEDLERAAGSARVSSSSSAQARKKKVEKRHGTARSAVVRKAPGITANRRRCRHRSGGQRQKALPHLQPARPGSRWQTAAARPPPTRCLSYHTQPAEARITTPPCFCNRAWPAPLLSSLAPESACCFVCLRTKLESFAKC